MRGLSWKAAAGVVALALAGGPALALSAAAPALAAACSGVPGDINGDGHADVAVAERSDALHVFYGTAKGLVAEPSGTALNDQSFTTLQLTSTALGGLGESALVRDMDGDGCADVVSGGNGAVVVLFGAPSGLSLARRLVLTPPSLVAGSNADYSFGRTLAVGDFDGDGRVDLAVGTPGYGIDSVGEGQPQGAVFVAYGGSGGPGTGARASLRLDQDSPGIPGANETDDGFGAALAAGDLSADGADDLVIGVPGENTYAGAIVTVRGVRGSGLGRATALSQDSALVPGVAEGQNCGPSICYTGDRFGQSLSAGDVNGDGADDVAVRSWEQYGTTRSRSTQPVVVLFGKGTGKYAPYASRSQLIKRPAVAAVIGAPVLLAPVLGGDRYADLVIADPRAPVGTVAGGSVTALPGRAAGLDGRASTWRTYSQATAGVAGKPEKADLFGNALAAAPIQRADRLNLVVGASGEWVNGPRPVPEGSDDPPANGSVVQFAATATRPTGTGSVTLNLDSPGVKGTAQYFSWFGQAVG